MKNAALGPLIRVAAGRMEAAATGLRTDGVVVVVVVITVLVGVRYFVTFH